MAPRRTTPILLLTGFLGAGKTSLLKRWIREPAFRDAMVIVNELGEVGLDQQLLGVGAEQPRLLENGCACCQASGDLASMLEDLFYDRLHRNVQDFSWVLIETTGLADPGPILDLLRDSDIVRERYELAGVVTAFDACTDTKDLGRFPEMKRQVEAASSIVLTHCDLADAGVVASVEACLSAANPAARVLRSAKAGLPAGELLEALRTGGPVASRSAAAAEHTRGVTTAFLPLPDPLSAEALRGALNQIESRHGKVLLRVKGLVKLRDGGDLHVVHATPSVGIEIMEAGIAESDGPLGLTLIASGVDAQAIARTLAAQLTYRGLKPGV
jgi:G3E family GTPase